MCQINKLSSVTIGNGDNRLPLVMVATSMTAPTWPLPDNNINPPMI